MTEKKRIYRRPHERPDPSQSHRAEVNRTTKKIGSRVSAEHKRMFDAAAKHFPDGGAALERAIELLAASVKDAADHMDTNNKQPEPETPSDLAV